MYGRAANLREWGSKYVFLDEASYAQTWWAPFDRGLQTWMIILGLGTKQIWFLCERIVKDYCQKEDYERFQKWVFLLLQEIEISFPPLWVCIGHLTGLSQWESRSCQACNLLKDICTSCFWNMLSLCKWDVRESAYSPMTPVTPLSSSQPPEMMWWVEQKLTMNE